MLVGFKELGLGTLMLLILCLKIAELAVQFVKGVFQILNMGEGFLYFVLAAGDRILLLTEQILAAHDSLLIIISF